MRENGKKLLRSHRGNSIVSVMMAFVVMLIVLAMFSSVILFANRMNAVAKQRTDEANAFIEAYYTSEAAAPSSGGLTMKRENGTDSIPLAGVGVGGFSDNGYTMYYFGEGN